MLAEAGYALQDMSDFNHTAALGVAVREIPTKSGPIDYLLFADGQPIGAVEAKAEGEFMNYKPYDSGRFNPKLRIILL